MQNQTASRTALATAYLRAAHQVLDAGPRILDDSMALRLLGPDAEQQIRTAADRYRSPASQALRAHVLLRSRYAEDQLEASLARGVGQYVLVGAGFDTFALRQPRWAGKLRIVEVDHPETQQLKLAKIATAGIAVPANVTFAGVDFERESLQEGLARAGVRRDVPTFFSWLGVTMYLTGAAIDATLRCMAAFPAGSEAVITFLQPPAADVPAEDALAARVADVGEPFVSYFTPEDFAATLRAAGFRETHVLTPAHSAAYFLDSVLSNPKRASVVSALV